MTTYQLVKERGKSCSRVYIFNNSFVRVWDAILFNTGNQNVAEDKFICMDFVIFIKRLVRQNYDVFFYFCFVAITIKKLHLHDMLCIGF